MRGLRSLGFVFACIAAIVVAGAGLVYANVSSLSVEARQAQLVTDTYQLGTPYAGTVQDMRVQRGDAVQAGEVLFTLQSPTLQAAMQKADFSSASVGYTIEPDGLMTFTAAKAGVVQKLGAKIGSFVKADTTIAQIAIADSLHLEGTFGLDARDYARVPLGGRVTVSMPDGTKVDTKIYDVEVDHFTNGTASTTIRARSSAMDLKNYSLVGAPVSADLHLKDDQGPGSWLLEQVGKLFTPGGFNR